MVLMNPFASSVLAKGMSSCPIGAEDVAAYDVSGLEGVSIGRSS